MTTSQVRFDELVLKLRERQWRMTPQRLALLRILASSADHPSAAQIYDRLRAQFPTTSLGTVYRTLSLLEAMGEVLVLGFGDDERRYDGRSARPHPHLICVHCHRIVDLEVEVAEPLLQAAARQSGFWAMAYRLDVYGLCPDCQSIGEEVQA